MLGHVAAAGRRPRLRPMLSTDANAHSRRRSPPATRRRALELLAGSRDGAAEAILLAHGVTVKMMVALIKSGLATAHTERVVAGGQRREVAYVKITEAGRQVLAGRAKR
jgi:hypothetical protein